MIWQVMISQKICITVSTVLFGHDTTGSWNLLGLGSTLTVALISVLMVVAITWFVSHGMDSIAKISTIGGTR